MTKLVLTHCRFWFLQPLSIRVHRFWAAMLKNLCWTVRKPNLRITNKSNAVTPKLFKIRLAVLDKKTLTFKLSVSTFIPQFPHNAKTNICTGKNKTS